MRRTTLAVAVLVLAMTGITSATAAPFAPADLGAISGTVTMESGGAAVVGASINIRAIKGGGGSPGTVTTTSGGAFQVNGVTPGTYWVKMNATGATPGLVSEQYFEDAIGWIPVEVEAGYVTTGVDISVVAAGSVSGTVTYDSSVPAEVIAANPVVVTAMYIDPQTGFASQFGGMKVVAANGSYTLSGLKPGEYTLRFSDTNGARVVTEFYNDSDWISQSTTFTIAGGDALTDYDAVLSSGSAPESTTDRLDGLDRFAAAVSFTQAAIQDGDDVPVVYIVNGLNFADALSAGPAAAYEGGALLLVEPTLIPQVVHDELVRIDPDRIEIVGGPASVSESVKAQLNLIAPTTRIGGADRFAVSRAVADQVFGPAGVGEAFIVTGYNYPDALSAGSVASIRGAAVILVDSDSSYTSPLDSLTRSLLVDLGVGEVHIVGGPASVSPVIESNLIAIPQLYLVDRFGGATRYEASATLAASFPQADIRFLATGANFPDALAGSWLAGRAGGAVILIPGTCIPGDTAQLLSTTEYVIILGGPGSVTPAVENRTVC